MARFVPPLGLSGALHKPSFDLDSLFLVPLATVWIDETLQRPSNSQMRPQVVPISGLRAAARRTTLRAKPISFRWIATLLVAVFLFSGVWTVVVAIIQLAPSEVANLLMDTGAIDSGDFWVLLRAEDEIAIPATTVLSCVAVGYLGLVVKILCIGPRRLAKKTRQGPSRINLHQSAQRLVAEKTATLTKIVLGQCGWFSRAWEWVRRKKTWLPRSHQDQLFTLPKLLLQTVTLIKYLHGGFPIEAILSYATLLLVNWLISASYSIFQLSDSNRTLMCLFYTFDLFFATFAPLQMLLYAYNNFHFDRAEYATRIEAISLGNFDTVGRMSVDPTQGSLCRTAFQSLQLMTKEDVVIKAFLNALVIRKGWYLISLLSKSPTSIKPRQLRALRTWNWLVAIGCIFTGLGIFVYSSVSIASSRRVCSKLLQCKIPSYRWNLHADVCSCTIFLDHDARVRSFAEWENPIDTAPNLAAAAATGDLKLVVILNRRVSVLPDELRGCVRLQQLVLLYTKTITIPTWAKELTNLQFIHIEGDFTPDQLSSIPVDFVSTMSQLVFLQLGGLPRIPAVPDLSRNKRLKQLTLALLHSVTILPSLDNLVNLRLLVLVDLWQVSSLPSLRNLGQLEAFTMVGRNPICCNGFLDGDCNLTNFSCLDRSAIGEPRVECSTEAISSVDKKILSEIGFESCDPRLAVDLTATIPTRESTDVACGGTMFKQCELFGVPGICYPSRSMVIMCELNPQYVTLRKLQIQRHVGDPCDPSIEHWLGCTSDGYTR